MKREVWAPVPGHEGAYEVSTLGRVRSVDRLIIRRNLTPYHVRGRVLRPYHRPDGRAVVALARGRRGNHVIRSVDALARQAFDDANTLKRGKP